MTPRKSWRNPAHLLLWR